VCLCVFVCVCVCVFVFVCVCVCVCLIVCDLGTSTTGGLGRFELYHGKENEYKTLIMDNNNLTCTIHYNHINCNIMYPTIHGLFLVYNFEHTV